MNTETLNACARCGVPTTGRQTLYGLCMVCALDEDNTDHPCRACGGSTANGEGWDGLCGDCADRLTSDDTGWDDDADGAPADPDPYHDGSK